jgi:S-adenosylmethionine:tRNA ribosyltransferase-isomerase
MSVRTPLDTLDFVLPAELEATTPAELRPGSSGRDDVRLLVAHRTTGELEHRRFTDLPGLLEPGDALVINVSKVVPASIGATTPAGCPIELHLSTLVPGTDLWSVELRNRSHQYRGGEPGWRLALTGGATAELVGHVTLDSRLWLARIETPTAGAGAGAGAAAHFDRYGEPIRYGYVAGAWPLDAYQNVYASVPGSVELPSAGRAFTHELLTRAMARGVDVVPIVLHCGVSSLEDHEPPYPEKYSVGVDAARRINDARRVIAVGTTVVRTLETVVDTDGVVHPGSGWTELVVRGDTTLRAVDGLLTGWHEPQASHLAMLDAVAGRDLLVRSYDAALAERYLWHEFGDLHLVLP